MFDTFDNTIGERIRFYRKQAHMTQKQLAETCEVSEPAIRNYELGNRVPDFEMLQTIAAALEVSYFALADPDIAAVIGAMHIFFRMEHIHGLKPIEINGKTGLVLDSKTGGEGTGYLQLALEAWKKANEMFEGGAWDMETYLTWESKYPAFSNTFVAEMMKSEGTPGKDAEKLRKHKRPRKSKNT